MVRHGNKSMVRYSEKSVVRHNERSVVGHGENSMVRHCEKSMTLWEISVQCIRQLGHGGSPLSTCSKWQLLD